jgi:hypothetical protein
LGDGLPLLRELTRRSCDYLGFVRNWRSMLAYGVPSANPIGPQTGLRTTLVGGGATAGQVIADGPANPQIDVGGYPPACALGPVAPLGAATR